MYESIVFIQGDEANEPLDILYNRESPDSAVYHGPDAASVRAAFRYLMQWDYGEPAESSDEPASGTSDDVWQFGRSGRLTSRNVTAGYRMSANLGLSYIGLERITP